MITSMRMFLLPYSTFVGNIITFFFLRVLTSILAGFWLVKIKLRSSSSRLDTQTPSLNWGEVYVSICLFSFHFVIEEQKRKSLDESPEEEVATKERATISRGSHTKAHPPPHPIQMQGPKSKSNDEKAYIPPPPFA